MARVSKKKEIECGDNNVSTGLKTRKTQKRLSRQVNETRVRRLSSSCGHQNSLNQTIISRFFHPLEVDTKKMQITSSVGTSRMGNSDLSSKRKIALQKYKPKKTKEVESKDNREKTPTKSIRSSRKSNDELLRNQRQLTEFYSLIEQISELSLSNKSEMSQNNDNSTLIREVDSNSEDDEIFEGAKEIKEANREISEASKQKKIINRNSNSINFDNNIDCDSSLVTSRFNLQDLPHDTLSYHLSNFSIEPNDSFITISPKVASNTSHFDLEVGNTPTKSRTIFTDAENLLDTMRDSSPQPNDSLNLNEESLHSNEQVEEFRYNNSSIKEPQVKNSSLNILSCHVDGSHRNNAANENEYLNNPHHNEMSIIEEGNKNVTNEISIKDNMIIEGDQEKDKLNDSVDNIGDDADNCEIFDEIINFHKEELIEREDHAMQEVNTNKKTTSMAQFENENQTKQKIYANAELLKGNILQEINLNKDTNCIIDDENLIDFHCCSQSENKCGFHQIYDLLDKENYNQDSISTFESFNDSISKELNGISDQEQVSTRQDRLPPTDYIHSSTRFSKDGVSPAPSPPSLLSQATLAMIPQSVWNKFPSFNVSTLDSEEFNDDL
ncbi:unnamed protein product [Rhizophagus irregularis]|uniref:Uncharacterized protein n=1 Tax=Rhizophagus irregularis TaxID=588596 RepID=A0A915Z4X5_9GLOM|nr:unnamed protein product [Rhizophagus irregularis]CAB5186907.1 unnamed protein product [Rhizophagus irregularis]CAB5360737.1 unnamed protein product [Rhizophagus irregularis]